MNFEFQNQEEDTLFLIFSGNWAAIKTGRESKGAGQIDIGSDLLERLKERLLSTSVNCLRFDMRNLSKWDIKMLVLIARIRKLAAESDIRVELEDLPDGLKSLIALSEAIPSRARQKEVEKRPGLAELTGQQVISIYRMVINGHSFLGEALLSFGRLFLGRAQFQRSDVLTLLQMSGPKALPIVSVVNILLGVILAFMGSVQLQQFGAEIYVANLVALGQTRDIAPMMTGIVMAGHTGAAYAAQLGTMQVNEETDALKTFGFSPMDFLVLPRMIALSLMMPILVLYADAIGIFGGFLIGVLMLDIGVVEYIEQTRAAIGFGDIILGVVKGSVFGILVALTGCMQGMNSGRSASAVGDAATSAVVSGIITIIVMTAIFAAVTNSLGI